MMTHTVRKGARRVILLPVTILLLVAILLMLGLPLAVLGHAELMASDPTEGATVPGPFTGPVSMTFSEGLAKESGAELVGSAGTLPATTAVDGSSMTLTPDTALVEGDFEIRWTSVADDGHIERGTIHFTVSPAPTPEPTASPTPADTATATASGAASVAPSASVEASPSTAASVAPLPTTRPDGGNTSSGGDVILPIIAAVVIIGGLAVYLLRRRDSDATGS
jgi:methionine-rich copper-binding protein CopC